MWANLDNQQVCPLCTLGQRTIYLRMHSQWGGALLCLFWDEVSHGHVTGNVVLLDYPD